MTEVKRNLVLFEDDPRVDRLLKRVLEPLGYSIVGLAASVHQANELIEELEELKVGAVIVDGNLTRGDYSNEDGEKLIKQIKNKFPEIMTIGYPSQGVIEGADFNSQKPDGPESLVMVLDEIFQEG